MIHSVRQISEHTILGIWKIDESLDQLKALVSEDEISSCDHFHPKKQLEHLASRLLVKTLCQNQSWEYQGIEKDEHGKPFFTNLPYHLSISHSPPWVGALIDQKKPCGIDIERPREQLLKIKRKFLNPTEQMECGENLDLLCLYWCAKESVYKIHGRKQLSFADNIQVKNSSNEMISTEIVNTSHDEKIVLHFEKIEDFYLVHSG